MTPKLIQIQIIQSEAFIIAQQVTNFEMLNMKSGSVELADGESKCILWVSRYAWISYDSNVTLILSGNAYLNYHVRLALNWQLYPKRDMKDFNYATGNSFPKNKVRFFCHNIPHEWSCEDRAEKCKLIMDKIVSNVIIRSYRLKEEYDLGMTMLSRAKRTPVQRMCLSTQRFMLDQIDRQIYCLGHDQFFDTGSEFCRRYFLCVEKGLNAITDYAKDSKSYMSDKRPVNDSATTLEYGIRSVRIARFEYVKKMVKKDAVIPYHYMLQCSWRQPFLTIKRKRDIYYNEPMEENFVHCERKTNYILQSFRLFPTCQKLIAECSKIFECMEGKETCLSTKFGKETEEGFNVDAYVNMEHIHSITTCSHWGVEVLVDKEGHRYCNARRFFKIKSHESFCQSFEWACLKLIHCLKTWTRCVFFPSKESNFSTIELSEIGLYNFPMPMFSSKDNPREQVPALYRCNKRYGFEKRVVLYFITSLCERLPYDPPECGVYSPNDESKSVDERNFDYRFSTGLLHVSGPGYITNAYQKEPHKLIYVWACKREVLSVVTCAEFIETCERIRDCLSKGDAEDETLDLPPDDTCFSPLPLSTINPLPENDAGGRGHTPGMLGASVSYTIPLQKTYPRIFKRLFYTGWDTKIGKELQQRRTKLFFNIFLEDCRWKHQFEGYLVEPYLTESVDYLICSIPFGIPKHRENSLVMKGCSQMRQTCENMKKCYVHHAEYFGFHSFFNDNVYTLALLMMVIFLLSLCLTVINQFLYPIKMPLIERLAEYLAYVALGFTSISLLVFSVEVEDVNAGFGTENSKTFLVLRLLWHLGSFLLTLSFHVYIVCFTFR